MWNKEPIDSDLQNFVNHNTSTSSLVELETNSYLQTEVVQIKLPNVVHNNVEIDNLGLTLLDVANFNVEIQIVFSTLI